MEGTIILDGKQYLFKDIVSVSMIQSEKQFTISLETSTKQFSEKSEQEILDILITKEVEDQVRPVEGGNVLDSTKGTGTVLISPSSPTIVHAETPHIASTNIRVSVEKPEVQKVPDLNPLVLARPTTTEFSTPTIPIQNQPSGKGILIPEKPNVTNGQRFAIGADVISILNRTRTEFGVVVIREQQREGLKLVEGNKKNVILKSEPFTQLADASVRLALQTLVMKEQEITHQVVVTNRQRDDFENVLFLEEPTQLVVVSIINEQQGLGEFYYEEMVSVYEGISTRTKVDNGKGNK